MRLTVTAEHIRRGEPNDPWFCPISLALKDIGFDSPTVLSSVIEIGKKRIKHSKKMKDFIALFDDDEAVSPHTFLIPKLKAPKAGSL